MRTTFLLLLGSIAYAAAAVMIDNGAPACWWIPAAVAALFWTVVAYLTARSA